MVIGVQEKEIQVGENILSVIEEKGGITILGRKDQSSRLVIPDHIGGLPVTALAKKAFLGSKSLTEVCLPDTVQEIGDWAFAHCSALKRLVLPKGELHIGKGALKGCKALSFAETGKGEETARLLAATPIVLEAEYLFLPKEAGTEDWLEKWDSRMLTLLRKNDESGFTRLVLCGEEDLLADLPEYVAEKRRNKAELCLLRLLNPMGLSAERKEELQTYLCTHAKGCESEAAWETVLQHHGEERAYYEQLLEAGCVTGENVADMLTDMGEGHTEMKALLMRYQEEHLKNSDFFASLSLD